MGGDSAFLMQPLRGLNGFSTENVANGVNIVLHQNYQDCPAPFTLYVNLLTLEGGGVKGLYLFMGESSSQTQVI